MSTPPASSRRYNPWRAATWWSLFGAMVGAHAWLTLNGGLEPLRETIIALTVLCMVVYGFVFRYAAWLNAAHHLNALTQEGR